MPAAGAMRDDLDPARGCLGWFLVVLAVWLLLWSVL